MIEYMENLDIDKLKSGSRVIPVIINTTLFNTTSLKPDYGVTVLGEFDDKSDGSAFLNKIEIDGKTGARVLTPMLSGPLKTVTEIIVQQQFLIGYTEAYKIVSVWNRKRLGMKQIPDVKSWVEQIKERLGKILPIEVKSIRIHFARFGKDFCVLTVNSKTQAKKLSKLLKKRIEEIDTSFRGPQLAIWERKK